jgi:hypothetical protein
MPPSTAAMPKPIATRTATATPACAVMDQSGPVADRSGGGQRRLSACRSPTPTAPTRIVTMANVAADQWRPTAVTSGPASPATA